MPDGGKGASRQLPEYRRSSRCAGKEQAVDTTVAAAHVPNRIIPDTILVKK